VAEGGLDPSWPLFFTSLGIQLTSARIFGVIRRVGTEGEEREKEKFLLCKIRRQKFM
jgi:hypothetical protein